MAVPAVAMMLNIAVLGQSDDNIWRCSTGFPFLSVNILYGPLSVLLPLNVVLFLPERFALKICCL